MKQAEVHLFLEHFALVFAALLIVFTLFFALRTSSARWVEAWVWWCQWSPEVKVN